MKTKCILLANSVLLAAAVAGLLHAAPPEENGPLAVEVQARRKVLVQIFQKISPREISFSRAMPVPRDTLEFQPQLLVDAESRLPFSIVSRRLADRTAPPVLQGYIRLSDQEIFLLDPKTGTHKPAAQHPLFAPPSPPPVKLEVQKPT